MLYSDDSALLAFINIESSNFVVVQYGDLPIPSHHLIIPLLPLVFSYEDSDMVISVDRFSVF